jgi:hypothetical protein
MTSKYQDQKQVSYCRRILTVPLLLYSSFACFIFSIINLFFFVQTQNFFFVFYTLLILPALTIILLISNQRAKYYLIKFSANADKIVFEYFEKNNYKTNSVSWNDFDFYFKVMRNDGVFRIYQSQEKRMIFYLKTANHEKQLRELYDSLFKYLPPDRITIIKPRSPFYSNLSLETAYSKPENTQNDKNRFLFE